MTLLMMSSCASTTKVSPIEAQERLTEPDSSCMVKSLPAAQQLKTGSTKGDMLATLTYNNYLWKQDRQNLVCLQNYVEVILVHINKQDQDNKLNNYNKEK